MNGARLYLMSRSPLQLAMVIAVLGGILALRPAGLIQIDLARDGVARELPFIEIVPVLGACLIAAMLRPRFLEWDHLGTWRSRCGAASVVALGVAVSLIPVLVGASRLPPGATWTYVPANVVLVASLAFVLCALLGSVQGAAATAVAFIGICLLQDLAPEAVTLVPIATPPARTGNWGAAIVALVVAVVVQIRTLGASSRVRRATSNGE